MPSAEYPSLRSIMQRQINAMQDAMAGPCEVFGKALTVRAQQVVADWSNKPQFEHHVTEKKGEITLTWGPIGKNRAIWYYVDLGTKPHIIMPVTAPKLRFQTNYVPKTVPVARYNVGPGKAFGRWVTRDMVFHPGNKGREFAQTALDELGLIWVQNEIRALSKAIGR